MNQLGFVICFIFTTFIAVSTPMDTSVHQAREDSDRCKAFNEPCTKVGECCFGLCESVKGNKVCTCKSKKEKGKHALDCCSRTRKSGKCACPDNPKTIPASCKSDGDCCFKGETCVFALEGDAVGQCQS